MKVNIMKNSSDNTADKKVSTVYESKRLSWKKLIIIAIAFGIIGTILLIRSRAAGPTASIEPEQSTISGSAVKGSDPAASGGSYVQFKAAVVTTPPSPSGTMPTKQNTGPTDINGTMTAAQFLASGVCDHKRITDQVRDESGQMAGRTFTINNCELSGGFYYANHSNGGNVPTSPMPIVNISNSKVINSWLMFSPMRLTADRVWFNNGYWTPCPNCGADDHQPNQQTAQMPVTVTNSLFWSVLPPADSWYHYEGLHVVSGGIGYKFTNTRFVQEGPMNGTQTGAIKFTGRDSIFTNVYFDFGGTPAASYFAAYFEGANVRINGCRIERGVSSYFFPDVWSGGNGYTGPIVNNCVDFHSGAGI